VSSFLNDLTCKIPFTESSGNFLDQIGGDDLYVKNGNPSYDEPGSTLDGIDDALEWTSSVTPPVRGVIDYSFYIKFKVTNQHIGEVAPMLNPSTLNATKQGPLLRWDDDGGTNEMRFLSHAAAGTTTVYLGIGRPFNIGETVVAVASYDDNTFDADFTVLSDQGVNVSGSATGTTASGWVLDKMSIGVDTIFRYWGTQLLEFGAIEGTKRSLADLQDTAQEVLFPGALIGGGPKNSFRLDPIRELRKNRGKRRSVR
jgi:hypothetical protein